MGINLDDLGSTKATKPEGTSSNQPAASGDLGLVFVGSKVNDKKSNAPVASRSISDIYMEGQKLVYLLDISGSMQQTVAGMEQVDHYTWPPEVMTEIENAIAAAGNKAKAIESLLDGDVDDEDDDEDEDEDSEESEAGSDVEPLNEQESVFVQLVGLTGDELKLKFLHLGCSRWVYVPQNWANPNCHNALNSKLGMVKGMTRQMVEERKAKFPESQIEVIVFNQDATVLPHTGTASSIADAFDKITASGGTSIMNAVDKGMGHCRRQPSKVKLHHFVLVTDGEDWGASRIIDYISTFKVEGIVLDFIWIAQPGAKVENDSGASAIKEACDATGGTFTIVTTATEFKSKFIQASQRLALPPASN